MADNLRLLKNIFQELQEPLFLGDGLNSGEFHVFMQPGQFVSTNLQETNNSDDMAIQAALTNILIDTKFIYTTLNGSLSQQYTDILKQAALPIANISAGDQKIIDDDRQWIANNDQAYTVFEKRYMDARDAYNQAASAQSTTSDLSNLYQLMSDAMNNWVSMGQKNVYEQKQAEIAYLSSENPATMWLEFNNLLNFHSKQAPHMGPYVQTFLVPPISQWNSAGTSWATYSKTINEADTYSYSSETSWGGGVSAGWGLWSIGAGGSGSSTYNTSSSDVSTVNVTFDYMRVRINRLWFVSDILNYRFWWWKKAFGYKLLSDGGNLSANPPLRPIGLLPFLPNYLIVAKNVSITANFSHNDATTISNSLNAGVSFGWGPFSCSGSYSESNTTHTTHASFDGTSIKIAQPQIIGYTGTLMPLVPNPDRTLPWANDHAPFDPPAGSRGPERALRRKELLGNR